MTLILVTGENLAGTKHKASHHPSSKIRLPDCDKPGNKKDALKKDFLHEQRIRPEIQQEEYSEICRSLYSWGLQ